MANQNADTQARDYEFENRDGFETAVRAVIRCLICDQFQCPHALYHVISMSEADKLFALWNIATREAAEAVAKREREIASKLQNYIRLRRLYINEHAAQQAEIERLREALRHYANKSRWKSSQDIYKSWNGMNYRDLFVSSDGWYERGDGYEVAQAALAHGREEPPFCPKCSDPNDQHVDGKCLVMGCEPCQ